MIAGLRNLAWILLILSAAGFQVYAQDNMAARWLMQKDSQGVPERFLLILPEPPEGCICPLARPAQGVTLQEEPEVRRVVLPEGETSPYSVLECRYLLTSAQSGQYLMPPPILPRGPWKQEPAAITLNLAGPVSRQAVDKGKPVNSFFGSDWSSSGSGSDQSVNTQTVRTEVKPKALPKPELYKFRWRRKEPGQVYEGVPVVLLLEHGYPATNPMRYDQVDLPIPQGAQIHDLPEKKKKKARFSRGTPWWPVLERVVIPLRSGPIEIPAGRWRLSPLKGRHDPFEVSGETLAIHAAPLPEPLKALGDFRLSWLGGEPSHIPAQGLEVQLNLVGDGYWPPDYWPLEAWASALDLNLIDVQDKSEIHEGAFVSDLTWRFRLTPLQLKPGETSEDRTLPELALPTSLPEEGDLSLTIAAVTYTPRPAPPPTPVEPEVQPEPAEPIRDPIKVPWWIWPLLLAILVIPLVLVKIRQWRSQSSWERALSRLDRLASAKTILPFYQALEALVRKTLAEMLDLDSESQTTSELEQALQQAGVGNVDFENFQEAWGRIQGHLYGMGRGDRRQMTQDLRFFRVFLKRLEQKAR